MRTSPTRPLRALTITVALLLGGATSAGAQESAAPIVTPPAAVALPFAIQAPPPPIPPVTSTRDESGRLTIRAVRLTSPLRVDGRLDEAVYEQVPSATDFVQVEPNAGAPATQKTEYWVFFDDRNVYAVVRAHESNLKGMVATEMRRDNNTLTQNEYVNFLFDTFYDRRNAQVFLFTPLGGRMDGQVTNEAQWNGDWNPVWTVRSGRFDGGWTAEASIPFRSLRYRPGQAQVWGLHVSRYNRWRNEIDVLVPLPRARGTSAPFMMSLAPTLVGIEVPPAGRNLEIKPFAIANLTSDRTTSPPVNNDLSASAGGDLKYGITQSVVADLTYNTDFAQVEADEQQVNLTRFSLFFPEKREFFLENRDVFAFGGVGTTTGGDAPVFFYSRRIGLSGSRIVPISVGGRLTGRFGRTSIGALDLGTKKDTALNIQATNFSVLRVKRDILRRSSIGAMYTGRSMTDAGTGSNHAVGADGTFAFFANLAVNTYWARSVDDGREGISYRGQLDYSGDRYAAQVEQLRIDADFRPDIGFVRRSDILKRYGLLRFSPRPRNRFKSVRKFTYQGSLSHLQNGEGRREWQDMALSTAMEYQSSDKITFDFTKTYEYIPVPFRVAPGVFVSPGGYDYHNAKVTLALGQQRNVNASITAEHGAFYNGTKTAVGMSRARLKLTTQLSVEPSFSLNHVELPGASFNTNLVGSRITYTVTPMAFVSALIQYNSSTNSMSSNVRFRYEYIPGSELFVVYNDQRDTLQRGFPDMVNRALIVKVNRLVRF